ncbi:MAG: GSCFA domain-containing protein [Saprospiraceae bacterium]|nr:GSCFA domain-containing protein [Saprospiraceae bacterium]
MRFRTELKINKSDLSLSYADTVVLLGSCFADNLGEKLEKLRFNAFSNPLGTFYNPVTAAYLIQAMRFPSLITEDQLIEREGVFAHHQFHSSFNHADPSFVISQINGALTKTRQHLESASFLFLTLGTAWVYETNAQQQVVSNCHKQPQHLFNKRLLTQNEIVESLTSFYDHLMAIHPACRLVLTLSPVRHTKDGLENNQLSKALLLTGMYEAMALRPAIAYFPAYEILMDDLRDYRFYADDLIHPNSMAVEYLWQKFSDRYFDEPTLKLIQEVVGINAFLGHRPLVNTNDYQRHLVQIKDQLTALNPRLGRPFDIEALL